MSTIEAGRSESKADRSKSKVAVLLLLWLYWERLSVDPCAEPIANKWSGHSVVCLTHQGVVVTLCTGEVMLLLDPC